MDDKCVDACYKKWAEQNNISYYSYDTCKEAYVAGYEEALKESINYSWDLK